MGHRQAVAWIDEWHGGSLYSIATFIFSFYALNRKEGGREGGRLSYECFSFLHVCATYMWDTDFFLFTYLCFPRCYLQSHLLHHVIYVTDMR